MMDLNCGLPIGERIAGKTDLANIVFVDSQIVPPGQVWRLNFAALNNESGETISVRWAVVRGSQSMILRLTSTLATGRADILDPPPILWEGELLRGRIKGTSTKAPVWLIYTGWRAPLEQPAAAG